MFIKHKDSKDNSTTIPITLSEWHNKYQKGKRYLNYEMSTITKIVDLYKISKYSNKDTYIRTMFIEDAEKVIKGNRGLYFYKNVREDRLDKYLMPTKSNYLKKSFLKKIKAKTIAIIKPISILKPVWKLIILIIIGGLGTLLGFILIEYYKNL
jgi:hypothetical protein